MTCEVAPHYLFLSEEDVQELGETKARVKPELCSKRDQAALWENMDVIDCFATDHAPHLRNEKEAADAPPGFTGFETMVPLLLNAVNAGRLTLDHLIEKLYTNPKRIFNLPSQPNTFVEVDFDEVWTIGEKKSFSKVGWTPFAGKEVKGKVRRVTLWGELAFVDDQVLVEAGFGNEIYPEIDSSLLKTKHAISRELLSPNSLNSHERYVSPVPFVPLTVTSNKNGFGEPEEEASEMYTHMLQELGVGESPITKHTRATACRKRKRGHFYREWPLT